MNLKKIILSMALSLVSLGQLMGQLKGEYVTTEGAWCWFADPRALHHENARGTINKSYIGYIDVHGNIKASQYDFNANKSEEVLVRSYFQPDDHNNPTFLVLPDDRVMIFYSRHTDEPCFYYRISEKPGDITQLGPELKIPTKFNTTYPSPFILSDDPDHFYICWRGISWHPTIAKFTIPDSSGKTETKWGPYQMVQSTASRPYAKYTTNGKDKIILAYTTGHPDPTMPNWLYYNYLDINTMELKDVNGKLLSKVGEALHHVAATDTYKAAHEQTVVDETALRDWLWQVTLDKDGKPGIAMVRINEDKSSHDYYYAKWTGTDWKKTFLSNGGGHFHKSPDIEKCYSAGMAIDDQDPNIIYCSVPVEGKYGEVYELIKYSLADNGEISATDTLTKNSKLNNVRPYIIPNRGKSPLKLTWMYGNYYDWIVSKDRPKGFSTAILADFNFAQQPLDSEGLVLDYKRANTKKAQREFKADGLKEFTILLNVSLDTANYYGTLITGDHFVYGIDKESLKPFMKVGSRPAVQSTNVLGNSDVWQTKPRWTNGIWYDPTLYTSVDLAVTYSNNQLTTYVNGKIDQVIEGVSCRLKEINAGKVVTQVNSMKVYNKKLNVPQLNLLP